MKNSTNLRAAILCLLVLFAGSFANAQPFNANLALRLQHTLDSMQVLVPTTKGMSIGVYLPGQGVWRGSSGISGVGIPSNPNMEYSIASNSKLFTAVAIMKLVENNTLQLDNPLSMWLPSITNVAPTITIRQLLNHTSGVADYLTPSCLAQIEADPAHIFTKAEILAFVGPKLSNPGVKHNYSNTNYLLAAMVIESATGISVATFMRNSVLNPLQLDSTFVALDETISGTIAHPWVDGVENSGISRNAWQSITYGAGSIYSTSGEMAQWYNGLFNGNLLTPASLAQVTNFLPAPDNYGFGLITFAINSGSLTGRTIWGHGGIVPGYRSKFFFDVALKASVCGLSNCTPSAIDGVTALMLKVLVDNLPASAGSVSGAASVCQGQNSVTYSVPLIARATSYTWTLPNGATGVSSTNSITVNYSAAALSGAVTVKGNNLFGSGIPASLSVTVKPLPATAISPGASASFCENSTLLLTASPVGTYLWSTGATTSSTTIISPGTYSVTVTVNGCSKSASTLITTNPAPVLNSISPLQAAIGANVVISGSNFGNLTSVKFNAIASIFTLNPPSEINAKVPAGATSGSIIVSNSFGCNASLAGFQVVASQACAKPLITPATGTYANPMAVTISCATAGSTIYYTTTGNNPVIGTSFTKIYTGSFQQLQSGTIRAMGVAPGFTNSAVAISYITITNPGIVVNPVFAPGTGTYSGTQNVTITTSTPGASLYYTTNGNTPNVDTPNSYTKLYSGPIAVAVTSTLKAIGVKAGIANSAVVPAYYTITNPVATVATPVISPATGSYTGVQNVSITCATAGSTIYYTTSGNVPVVGTSYTRLYAGSFMLTGSATIRAMAVKSGSNNSAVAVSYITISGPRIMFEDPSNKIQTPEQIQTLLVYPNPCTGILNLQSKEGLKNARIEICNSLGNVLMVKVLPELTSESVSIQSFPVGIYSIRIAADGFSKEIRVIKP